MSWSKPVLATQSSEKLQEWEDYYNYHRPHGALGGQTPYERLRHKAQDPLS
jgi:transposase InsO family protein